MRLRCVNKDACNSVSMACEDADLCSVTCECDEASRSTTCPSCNSLTVSKGVRVDCYPEGKGGACNSVQHKDIRRFKRDAGSKPGERGFDGYGFAANHGDVAANVDFFHQHANEVAGR
mmetsp:Transcript_7002/g.16344  ORF Transcript_7002/g.16344 Transcript_7002/m.16344 type:complete len:118 (-) Transcript_7002:343-696(-)